VQALAFSCADHRIADATCSATTTPNRWFGPNGKRIVSQTAVF
jgi:hypothetical protein